ncbi:MAG: hypothetical protein J6X28_01320 [Bacilli bacterium]|nr:hypothetical protein [Bacilli bacterium]
MKEELAALINDELDKTEPSIEEIYSPMEEEIKKEIEAQNEKAKKEQESMKMMSHEELLKKQEEVYQEALKYINKE